MEHLALARSAASRPLPREHADLGRAAAQARAGGRDSSPNLGLVSQKNNQEQIQMRQFGG